MCVCVCVLRDKGCRVCVCVCVCSVTRAAESECVCVCARRPVSQHTGRRCPMGTLAAMLVAGLVSCLPSDKHTSGHSPRPAPSSTSGLKPRLTKPPGQGPSGPGLGAPSPVGCPRVQFPHPQHKRPGSCCSHLGEPSGRHVNSSACTSFLKHETTY